MAFWDRMMGWLVGAAPPTLEITTSHREAAGQQVDHDDDDWKPLTGDGRRDLSPMTQARMQKLAVYLWESNLLANRLIELPLAYLLAKGVKLTHPDKDLQAVLDRHWNDGINCWALKLEKKVRELSLFGEQCWPVFVGENDFVRVGYLDPCRIETVVMDPDNAEQPIGVVTKKNARGESKRYRVIVNVDESAFSERTREIRSTFDTGDAFYFRVNDLCNSTRGRSDLLAQIDWLDAYDEFLFGELERGHQVRAFVWDLTLKGATPEQVRQRAKEFATPKPGSAYVHNEAEVLEPLAPELNAYDAANAAALIRNHILGGATVPEHWYGGAGDVNRATGVSMAEPTEKMLEKRQGLIGYQLLEVGRFVIRCSWKRRDEQLDDTQLDTLSQLTIEWPEMTAKDTTKYAAALAQVVQAAASMIADGLVSQRTAVAVIATIAAQLGIEIDPDEELRAARDERAKSGDVFSPAALDDETTPPSED